MGMTLFLAILCLGFCCVVNGRSFFDSNFGNDLDSLNNKKVVDVLMQQFGERPDDINGCSCNKTGCYCCKIIDIPEIQFHKKCCFNIRSTNGLPIIVDIAVLIENNYELQISTGAPELVLVEGCISPRVKNGVLGFRLDILSNSTNGFSAYVHLAVYKQLYPVGCFTLNYKSHLQNDEYVKDSCQDWETAENDVETVNERKEIYPQMKRNDVNELTNMKEVDELMHEFARRPEEGNGCICNRSAQVSGCFCCGIIDKPEIKFRENCCFDIIYFYSPTFQYIAILIKIGKESKDYLLNTYTFAGNLLFLGGYKSPKVNNGVIGYELDIKSNSTSGLTSCAYLAIGKPPLFSMGCFTLNYTSNAQSDEDVQDFHQDSEAVENDVENVYQKNELYTQMKRSLFMNKEN